MVPRKINNIAVFCGSNTGNHPSYADAAINLANALIQSGINLVYGGGKIGLMGIMADAVLNAGGQVFGVIPQGFVEIEVAHTELTNLKIVSTMHERKKLMSELADGFIMLPGGAGSLDEFFEIFTWYQLGLHAKPCGIINTNHYFDHLIHFLDHSVKEGFLKSTHRDLIFIEESPAILLDKFANFIPNQSTKWI